MAGCWCIGAAASRPQHAVVEDVFLVWNVQGGMGERNCDERKGFVYFPVFFSVLSLSKLGKSFQPTTTTTHNIFSPSHYPWILPLQLWESYEFVAHGSAVIWVLWAVRDRLWSLSGWSEVTALELSYQVFTLDYSDVTPHHGTSPRTCRQSPLNYGSAEIWIVNTELHIGQTSDSGGQGAICNLLYLTWCTN